MENRKLFRSKIQLLFTLYFNGYLRDIRLFKAFLDVPLKEFIPKEIQAQVRIYNDAPVLFYFNKERPETLRTISAPHMISIMLQELILNDNDDLLILGAKSGYIAALAHKLAPNGRIVIIEANPKIANVTLENLRKANLLEKVEVIVRNPLLGFSERYPWQKILVTGAIKEDRISTLLQQLDPNEGVLFAPIGEDLIQTYTQIIRYEEDFYGKKHLQVRFTPLMTQVELDKLKLDIGSEELDVTINQSRADKFIDISYMKNISVNYESNILDEVRLEPYSKSQSYEIKPENIFDAFLQHKDQTINSANNKENLEYLENIINSLEQIKTYNNFIRKEIEKRKTDSPILDKKIKIIEKYQLEVNSVQTRIKKEMNKFQ